MGQIFNNLIFYFLPGLIVGWYVKINIDRIIFLHINKKRKEEVESLYLNILKNKDDVIFVKRSGQYVTLQLDKNDILFNLDKSDVIICEGKEMKATSKNLDKSILNEVITFINTKFRYNIYEDVVIVNKIAYSKSLLDLTIELPNQVKKEQSIEYDLDSILDKINESGYDKLSEEEKKYLKGLN